MLFSAIKIARVNGERCVYRGDKLIANIYDHRSADRKTVSTVQGPWMVAWLTGRVDWHDTLAQARDNALKGN